MAAHWANPLFRERAHSAKTAMVGQHLKCIGPQRLTKSDLTDVDRNQDWIGNLALIIVESNNSASRRHHDSVNLTVIVCVIQSPGPAHDVDNILVPAQQSIFAKV